MQSPGFSHPAMTWNDQNVGDDICQPLELTRVYVCSSDCPFLRYTCWSHKYCSVSLSWWIFLRLFECLEVWLSFLSFCHQRFHEQTLLKTMGQLPPQWMLIQPPSRGMSLPTWQTTAIKEYGVYNYPHLVSFCNLHVLDIIKIRLFVIPIQRWLYRISIRGCPYIT